MGASIEGVICQPRTVTIPSAGGAKGREESLPSLTLDEATGLIALEGIVFANANPGKCLKDLRNCNLMWSSSNTIAKFQKKGFASFHIYGGHDRDRMKNIQAALANPSRPTRIVSIDQELGFVNRFGWTPDFKYIFPPMLTASGNPGNAYEAGYLTGQLLSLYGISLNFAPFVDLHAYTPRRRFSDDPGKIAVYAGAFMQGLLRAGVGACAKHFPDGSNLNTHDQISRVNLPIGTLHIRQRYQPLIDAGLPAIMVGHDIFTRVDPNNPASLSKRWITDILRGQMNFQGVVVTDALGMGAIQKQGITERDAILRAFEAGADLLLANPDQVRSVLKDAVASGRISPERVCESARRLQIFARRFPISSPPTNRNAREADIVQRASQLYQKIKVYWQK